MSHSHRSMVAAFVVLMLVFGSVGSATAGLQDCLPKACCCMNSGHKTAAHMLPTDAKNDCTGSAPCCRKEPPHKAQEFAALPSIPELPKAKVIIQATFAEQQLAAQATTPFSAHACQHNGKPRAPMVPLYLETQMLLC